MDEWLHVIRLSTAPIYYDSSNGNQTNVISGAHVWYSTSHARPTYCNVCREQLCGVTSQGLSCEICKYKSHKRCVIKAVSNCKWTTLSSMGKDIIEESDGTLSIPHQWMEGNLPVSAKCDVCERTCGSVLRLQDLRCLWCRACVHSACKPIICEKCPVGRISVVPPTALHTIGNDDTLETPRSLSFCSPLLVFVNSKSGDHQGLKFLRRFKQLLNPAQVFDLMNGGPRRGLEFFRNFEPFRILVCGGDGSVGWVMSEIDKLGMHRQLSLGVLPLGTGNDLARVLGWGSSCDDDSNLTHLLDKYERATTKMLDRWSVMTFERGVLLKPPVSSMSTPSSSIPISSSMIVKPKISHYEDSVASHLQNIIQSNQNESVIQSAKFLCETVRDMIGKIAGTSQNSEIEEKCLTLTHKLDSLLLTLQEETDNSSYVSDSDDGLINMNKETIGTKSVGRVRPGRKLRRFRQRDTLMLRANSLRKAVRQIIEHAERTIDETTSPLPIVVVRPLSLQVSNQTSNSDEDRPKLRTDDNPISPIDPNMTLPVPIQFADQERRISAASIEEVAPHVQKDYFQSEEYFTETKPIENTVFHFPTIEVESPSTSSFTKSPTESEGIDADFSSSNTEEGCCCERRSVSPLQIAVGFNNLLTVPKSPNIHGGSSSTSVGTSSSSSVSTSPQNVPTVSIPRGSRRISMGSLCKSLEIEIPKSPNAKYSFLELNGGGDSGRSGSISPLTPTTCSTNYKKKLPIVNPLVSHPSWPSVSSGSGVVSKVLLANADTICAVASPLMDPTEGEEDLMIGFNEKCVLNNYFGIGIDAKITLDFHLKREEHPEKCRSRTKNFMWYGVLGSKEYLQQTCKNLEQRVQLECDGKMISLPSLQGIVVLNIQSFMGGTNFWGGTKEDDCFLAPSFDDRILEVVAVFDSMQMAASRLINLQHHRIAQCQSVKITILGDDPIPVQVDGEAWLQPPGLIKIVHKNRMQMLCRNRALESSLRSWEEKQRQHVMNSPTSTESEDLDKKRHKRLFSLAKLREYHHRGGKEGKRMSDEATTEAGSDEFSGELYSVESKEVEEWTLTDIGDWLDYLNLGEYKFHFERHDIQGAELITLQRRDLKELGITKVGHIKRILQGIQNLNRNRASK